MTRPLRILVVDDDDDTAQLLADVFRRMGHSVAVAHDGHEALAQVDRHEPEVAFLDLDLREVDGADLAKRLQQRLAEALLVAVTAHGGPTKPPFADHIQKPADLKTLKELLARAQWARDLLARG